MKKFRMIFLWIPLALIATPVYAQQQTVSSLFALAKEIYFEFKTDDPGLVPKLSAIISLDQVDGKTIRAYANKNEFEDFLKFNIPYHLLPHPGKSLKYPVMRHQVDIKEIASWDFYPDYPTYVDMMYQFAADYPGLCETVNFGTTTQGRELLAVKISGNIGVREPEPQFLYTGTIHGDETTGYVLLLRLIDHLLTNYGSDPAITALVDGTGIWINPLSNPDGTFAGGNQSVYGATRYNANGVDLNRNYPDPDDGPHPDGNAWQPETLAFMQLAEAQHFVMAANTHGGSEVINYPWDTWQHLTADDDWWVFVSREYADTVHQYAPSYYLDGFDNGITNGYAWYTISGGRQDYMNYYHHCREVTMELSNTKLLPAAQLPDLWEWNHRSLLNYIRQCTYGVAGVVTDAGSGMPLSAEIFIEGHDMDQSRVFCDSSTGYYQRLLEAGTYDLTFSARGYPPVTVPQVNVSRYNTVDLDVQLDAGPLQAALSASETVVPTGTQVDFTDLSFGGPVSWTWTFEGGKPEISHDQNPQDIKYNNPGCFAVSLTISDAQGDSVFVRKSDFITVAEVHLMSNQTLTTCSSLFYDSGGPEGNYGNNQNQTFTVIPATAGAKVRAAFLEFSLEPHYACNYDWLKIYDGSGTSAPLIGTFCGSNSPGIITATNPEGALTFSFHSDYNVTHPGWKALLSCRTTQQIVLAAGWNSISTYVRPDDADIMHILQPVMTQVILVSGDGGIFWPEGNVNTIENWNHHEAYWMKMQDTTGIEFTGTIITNQRIQLDTGWNFVAFPSPCAVEVSVAADQLSGNLVMIREAAGLKVFWPEKDIYQLPYLLPGHAYLFRLSAPAELIIPDCE